MEDYYDRAFKKWKWLRPRLESWEMNVTIDGITKPLSEWVEILRGKSDKELWDDFRNISFNCFNFLNHESHIVLDHVKSIVENFERGKELQDKEFEKLNKTIEEKEKILKAEITDPRIKELEERYKKRILEQNKTILEYQEFIKEALVLAHQKKLEEEMKRPEIKKVPKEIEIKTEEVPSEEIESFKTEMRKTIYEKLKEGKAIGRIVNGLKFVHKEEWKKKVLDELRQEIAGESKSETNESQMEKGIETRI